jgi:hypothetical protein
MHGRARVSARDSFFALRVAVFVALAPFVARMEAAQAPTFGAGVTNGIVDTYLITEASGIVASRQSSGVLWTHNDSGYRGSVFALATNGVFLGRYYVPDIFDGDFEDIAIGPGPLAQFQYIYLGDIGDNFVNRTSIRVLRFPEPAAYAFQSNAPVEVPILNAEQITLSYPDGPFNAEALMVDPLSGDMFITTKDTNTARLYRATRAELDSGQPVTLTFMREISFRSVSGADISPDGSLIAIRRPGKGGLWLRSAGQTVSDALAASPITIPVIGQPIEPNGESIGFDPDAWGYYTLSEGVSQPLYFFPRTSSLPPRPRVLVAAAGQWQFNDFGAPVESNWRTNLDEFWFNGSAPLGYGGGEQTTVSFGDDFNKYPTTYFRKAFTNTATLTNLALRVCFNDGIAVYLNGTEILRRNLNSAAVYETYATRSNTNAARCWFSVPVNPALLRRGTNYLAAEVHRADPDGPTLVFDAQLVEGNVDLPPRFTVFKCTNSVFAATVRGPNALLVRIEDSADSVNWETNRFLTLTNGAASFTERDTNGMRFYRIPEN